MTLADNVITLQGAVATMQNELTALAAAVAAIPTTAIPAAPVDFTPVLTAIAAEDAEHVAMASDIKTVVTAVTPTPAP